MISRYLLAAVLLATPVASTAQVARVEPDDSEAEEAHDPSDVRGAARDVQRDFERTRLRHARLRLGGGISACDEYVGRFCTSYDEGEWYPRDEAEEVVAARAELIAELDSLQRLSPADGWILGQRVWYRADGGDWGAAYHVSTDCGRVEDWWCAALQGLALHGLGRYGPSLDAFERALDSMDPERAREWRVPQRAVDRDARRVLENGEEAGRDSLAATLSLLWALADPLYLVQGNDRLSEHYARWTVSELKRDARNPYGIGWGDDLEELTVRHGWELGWERSRNTLVGGRETAIGHKHPDGRDFMPSGRALRDPSRAESDDLGAHRREPRSLYAPVYAPIVLPMEGQLAVFPRGERVAVVVTAFLPEDTTFHSRHTHPRPWLDAGDQEGMPDRIGLFALPVGGGPPVEARRIGTGEGALLVEVDADPTRGYVLSAESWSPELRRAGRLRVGLRAERPPEDIPTLSDLLLLEPAGRRPATLAQALPRVLPRPRISQTDSLAVVWELYGLGFREESLEYALSVERTDRSLFNRIGGFFGLVDRPQPLALSWQEPAPDHPASQFRYLALDLPPLDAGDYRITLTLRTSGRSDTEINKDF
jgi:tetratricopeptide (TPR) repeat protein